MLINILPKTEISAKENLQWLFILRNLMIGGESLLLLISIDILKIPLHQEALWLTILAIGTVNLYTWIRLKTDVPVTEMEIFSQLAIDVLAIAALLYLTGGATNPFTWIFLLPVILTAITLPHAYTWYMVILTTTIYTFLIPYHASLLSVAPHLMHAEMGDMAHNMHTQEDEEFFNFHIFGMWFGFVCSAGLVAFFSLELSNTIKAGERTLAEAREKALQDDRIISLGTLAASAAHDMGTPLGTMAIIAHELKHDTGPITQTELHEKMTIMQDQINRCKQALSVMSASAGELRADSGHITLLSDYLDEVIMQWRSQQPGVKLNLLINPEAPLHSSIIAELTLTHSLINILNNAAEASPQEKGIDLAIHRCTQENFIGLQIRDYGPGIPDELLDKIGKAPINNNNQGLGVGLFLTYSTINRIGGTIEVSNSPTGGACIDIFLPLVPS
ncbi:ATP-binding protein [methanotrophic endosymbiont of Bathymodiolus puteoserpentis (Logatchev)]|jgi:two-component system sensor histidine kinase RegB|uniref:ATP-binding protein n=1 Tax=methanotrophic endosymbiont of Bathymodiolus puteoserpentis (Logatchev) TaxID=343235 RepID=UPI0013CC010F|nr:ATP-binding protein [methanotrophic endosymbiont of Bathymodiolus puteoserpentis (Logatchev)]SHE22092.1 Sensor histidine kinase PrrB (RegB) [methanotrophic endosymbiont of Bathymodiolus puteoserpentis (Logatchev)]